MAIGGLGLLLFALLIGNMQNFLLALGRRYMNYIIFFLHFGVYIFVAAVGIILHFTLTKQEYSVACMHIYDEASQLKIIK